MKLIFFTLWLLLMPLMVFGIVYNSAQRQHGLPLSQVKAIFLLKVTEWPNGGSINVYSLPPTHPGFVKFFSEELGLNPYQIEREWYVTVYSGRGYYPTIVPNFQDMKTKLDQDKDSIGYLPN